MSICNVQKLVSNVFDNEKYMIHYENLKLFLRLGLKLKIYIAYVEFNTQKRIGAEKNGGKDGKAFYKLMNNAVYGKSNIKLKKKQHQCKFCNQEKDYLKWTSQPSYISSRVFDYDLVVTLKNKVILTLNKPEFI